ncbi:MAG: RNA polymerase sigma factor [Ruminococcaceae bacterium]|nr:RNA polymerase sigma factor [Oscillospiraceae bacterium]
MNDSSARPADAIETVIRTYGNALYRLCFVILGSESDAEDAVQETFIRYLQKAPQFENPDHEKAWLITVATNQCRDILRFRKRHPQIDSEYLQEASACSFDSGILEALMTLPEKFRLVLALYYVEEYRIDEIAQMVGKTPSAVKMRLRKGRKLLEEVYRKEYL